MPVPGVDIAAFEPFAYGGSFYFFSNETGWGSPLNSSIRRVYEIEEDLFLADASVSVNDEGYLIYYGHDMAVFQQKDDSCRLLKIYPMNTLPDLAEVHRYIVKADISRSTTRRSGDSRSCLNM